MLRCSKWRSSHFTRMDTVDEGISTPKAPRELRLKLKNGEITEAEFERQLNAIKAKVR